MPERKRLPDTRGGLTHKVEIFDPGGGVHSLYITIGYDPEGRLGEVFLKMGKQGSTVHGLLDVIGLQTSLLLQYGADPEEMTNKLAGRSFPPSGATDNPDIPTCTSIVDYLAQWLRSL